MSAAEDQVGEDQVGEALAGEGLRWLVYRVGGARPGEVLRQGRASSAGDAQLQAGPGEAVLLLPEDAPPAREAEHHVVDAPPALAARPVLAGLDRTTIPADGETAARMTIPAGAAVEVEGAAVAVEDGVLEIAAALPGRIAVRVSCWPWQDYEVAVEVGDGVGVWAR